MKKWRAKKKRESTTPLQLAAIEKDVTSSSSDASSRSVDRDAPEETGMKEETETSQDEDAAAGEESSAIDFSSVATSSIDNEDVIDHEGTTDEEIVESDDEDEDGNPKDEMVPRKCCGRQCGMKKRKKKYVSLFRIYAINPAQIPLLIIGAFGTSSPSSPTNKQINKIIKY